MVYELAVNAVNDFSSLTVGSTSNTWCSTHSCYDWCFHYPNYSYYWTTYPTTIYKYQLTCPRCATMNWGELDKVFICSGKIDKRACKAKIKAVTEKIDYEIPVGG